MILLFCANIIACIVAAIVAPTLAIVTTGNAWFAVFYLPWCCLGFWLTAPEGPYS